VSVSSGKHFSVKLLLGDFYISVKNMVEFSRDCRL